MLVPTGGLLRHSIVMMGDCAGYWCGRYIMMTALLHQYRCSPYAQVMFRMERPALGGYSDLPVMPA